MKFRTEYTPSPCPSENRIDPFKPVVLLGSCFSDNIGRRMAGALIDAHPNPLGVLYNPVSISRIIFSSLNDSKLREMEAFSSLFADRDIVHSWMYETQFSALSVSEALEGIMCAYDFMNSKMSKAGTLIVTFGTAYVYELAEHPGYIVSNCHKQPSAMFNRRRLTVDEIVELWTKVIKNLKEAYPRLNIIFTVSPVRHIKDGLNGNALSKSILLMAVEKLCALHSHCSYFPAFEIMTDDLRDYRFYGPDLVHPSDTAVDYIWDIFKQTYFSDKALKRVSEGEMIARRMDHRSLVPDSPDDLKFQAETQRLLKTFRSKKSL